MAVVVVGVNDNGFIITEWYESICRIIQYLSKSTMDKRIHVHVQQICLGYIPWYTILDRWNRNVISLLQQASAQKPHNFISFIKPTIKLNNAIINSN